MINSFEDIILKITDLLGESDALDTYISMCGRIHESRPNLQNAKTEFGYIERHHVVPISFDKELRLEKANIIFCTAEEHFELHCLLEKASIGKRSLHAKAAKALSAFTMKNSGQERVLTAEQYGIVRRACSLAHKGVPNLKAKGSKRTAETRHKMGAWQIGRKIPTETRQKLSKQAKRRHGNKERLAANSSQLHDLFAATKGFADADAMDEHIRGLIEEKLTCAEICKRLKITIKVVRRVKIKFGLERRTINVTGIFTDRNQLERAILRTTGSATSVAREFGVSPKVVYDVRAKSKTGIADQGLSTERG